MSTTAGTDQLRSVQYLRAIAALLVTIAHASEEARYFYDFVPWFETDAFGKGVDLFFVISGFIIYYASTRLFGTPGASVAFARNRAVRVIPLYYLATTLMVAVVLFLPSGVKEARSDILQIVTSYAFVPYERYDGRIAPILSLGWTLNYEIFFYTLFSLCLLLPSRLVGRGALALICSLALVGVFVPDDAPAPLRAWTDAIILEFAMGIAIAVFYENRGKLAAPAVWALLLAGVGFALLYVLNTPPKPLLLPRFVTAGLPAAMIVFAAVVLLPRRCDEALPSFGVALGNSSYSLYLCHRFVQRPIQILITRYPPFGLEHVGGAYVAIAVVAAVAAGHVTYLFVERPLLALMRGKRRARPRVALQP
jgi:exopolysaccharide production protein ExoZ